MPSSWHKKCLACGREFTFQRRTAKYCSDACRKRGQRGDTLTGRLDKKYDDACDAINSLALWIGRGGEMDSRSRNRLIKLRELVDAALSDTTLRSGKMSFFICQECGQSFFGYEMPGFCAYCEHETLWEKSPLNDLA